MTPEFLQTYKKEIDKALKGLMEELLEKDQSGTPLGEGMEKALMAGGKRIRPVFCLLGGEAGGLLHESVMPFALALEMLHTYSLVHDDLPAMDDDSLRRGQPTSHILYGEGQAILIGDALLTHGAAQLLAPLPGIPPERQLKAAAEVLEAIGIGGMLGGQAADLKAEEGEAPDSTILSYIHRSKTGRLLEASLVSGGILAGADEALLRDLSSYGAGFGLVFQITDDILDLTASTEVLGKPVGSDEKNSKLTYPAVYGLEASRRMAEEEVQRIAGLTAAWGAPGARLAALAAYLLERKN